MKKEQHEEREWNWCFGCKIAEEHDKKNSCEECYLRFKESKKER